MVHSRSACPASHRRLVSGALELLIPARRLTGWPRSCGVSMIAKTLLRFLIGLRDHETPGPSRARKSRTPPRARFPPPSCPVTTTGAVKAAAHDASSRDENPAVISGGSLYASQSDIATVPEPPGRGPVRGAWGTGVTWDL